MTAEATAPPRPRSAFQLMFDPVFGALFWGKMLPSLPCGRTASSRRS